MLKLIAYIATFLVISVPSLATPSPGIVTQYSPYNKRRPHIKKPKFIILHTTEGSVPGSLDKLHRRGEAHFLVTQSGQIIQLMDTDRLAKHAGRSIWDKRRAIDNYSIGIETEGFHNYPPPRPQAAALKFLISELRKEYDIKNDHILTHSMVAYGTPNRWVPDEHRGRKRCGMMMARPGVRRNLGITDGPDTDPDVLEDRLIIGDRPLFAFLFNPNAPVLVFKMSASEINQYIEPIINPPEEIRPPLKAPPRKIAPPVVIQPKPEMPDEDNDEPGTFREIGKDGDTAFALAGNQYAKSTTIYFLPDGRVRTGKQLNSKKLKETLAHLPRGTKVLVGYIYGGNVLPTRSAFSIAKKAWNDPATIYRLPNGKLLTGDEIAQNSVIPEGTLVLFQR